MDDPYDLARFVEAQASTMAQVLSELKSGRKTTHWMWFVFPQIEGLGRSPMARRYAIASLQEATAYEEHALLGSRLRTCTSLVNEIGDRSIGAIFGSPDEMKFQSCMTLFARAAPHNEPYLKALEKYFGGEVDKATVERLAATKTIL